MERRENPRQYLEAESPQALLVRHRFQDAQAALAGPGSLQYT
jgi:hypothetical protein